MASTFNIIINRDIEDKDFKENFFYHFDKRETAALAAALFFGGIAYAGLTFLGVNQDMVTLVMAVVAVLPLLLGFYKKQGLGIIDYTRKKILVKLCSELVWESTEDPGSSYITRERRTFDELEKKDI